jgi:hypothetical protein
MVNFKNYILLLFTICLLGSISQAQGFKYGFSIGLSKSNAIFESEQYGNSSNSGTNYHLLALIDFPTRSNIRFQTGLKYFRVGYDVAIDIRTFTGPAPKNFSTDLSIIAIPVNLNYILPFFPNGYVSGGLEGTYLLSASSRMVYEDNSSAHENISNQLKDFNLFFAAGIGIDFPLSKFILFVKPEYTRSVFEVTENISIVSNHWIETFVLNAGLKF